ncbi:hypothetical protein T08_16178 [Trichinella sp. T8]|nr:hypothetical protein T08_16178 [Trichinella sp. T8]
MLDGLFSLTPNMIAWHRGFQFLDETRLFFIKKCSW